MERKGKRKGSGLV